MNGPRTCLLALTALAATAWGGGTDNPETALVPRPGEDAPPADKPLVLTIAIHDIYCRKTACECISEIATREYTGVIAALESRHKITIKPVYYPEVFDLEKAVLSKSADGVICKPWTALRLASRAGSDFKRVADVADPDGSAKMHGVFLTMKDSPIQSLGDLKGRKIAFGQEDSYEKNQSPLAMLAERGITTGTCMHPSSCGENLDALMKGKVDAAVISSYAMTASCAVDFAKPEDFKTIATTEEMPLTSVLLDMNKVSRADALRLRAALLELSGKKAPGDFSGGGFVEPAPWQPVIRPAAKTKHP